MIGFWFIHLFFLKHTSNKKEKYDEQFHINSSFKNCEKNVH